MIYPKNMIEFIDSFSTEEQCLLYLEQIRWWWVCPKCWSDKYWRHWKRRVRICAWCQANLRVTAWTTLDHLRISLRKLLLIAWFMVNSKQWVSSEEIATMLDIDNKTAWLWNQKFRKIMVIEDRTKLSWNVEIDEVFMWWKQAWTRWRWANWKVKIVVAVEINMEKKNKAWLFRWMWRIRIKIIPNCWEKTLGKFIENNVEKESTIYTDWWSWYKNIDKLWYKHIVESNSITDDEVCWINTDEVTPNVHIIASLLKRWLLGTHQKYLTKWWYLQDYLEEYTFRFNRRKSDNRWKLFSTIIEQIISNTPITRKTIKMKKIV